MDKDTKPLTFSMYVELYSAHGCFESSCPETYALAGRKFAFCNGCNGVPYCSKVVRCVSISLAHFVLSQDLRIFLKVAAWKYHEVALRLLAE